MSSRTDSRGIRPLRRDDWGRVRTIYEQEMATGDATFATEAPNWESWDRSHFASCRIVAERGGRVVGWAGWRDVGEMSSCSSDAAPGPGPAAPDRRNAAPP